MKFKRPVADEFPVSAEYGQEGHVWSWHIGPDGRWAKGQSPTGTGNHKGIDFAVPVGTPIYAMSDGVVNVCGWENYSNPKQGFGLRIRQQVVLDDGQTMTLVYGHLSKISTAPGNQVIKGDLIAHSGNSGHTTGPHLHVELVDSKAQYHPMEFA